MSRNGTIQLILGLIVFLTVITFAYAGSDRLIMSMSAQRMDQEDLVYVQFLGPDGVALETLSLGQMIIRANNCSTGTILKIIDEYKIGYSPESMLVGIYLYPQAWKNKKLCFRIPELGMVERGLDPTTNKSRSFQLKFVP